MIFMLAGRFVLPIKNFGYKMGVLFTPLVELFAGIFFFVSSYFAIGDSALAGGFLVMMAKSAKYAFFDTTKEMIFIPLDAEAKSLGKAAIELVCYRLAKSGGSFFLQVVIFFAVQVNSPLGLLMTAGLFFSICLVWIVAAVKAEQLTTQTEE